MAVAHTGHTAFLNEELIPKLACVTAGRAVAKGPCADVSSLRLLLL